MEKARFDYIHYLREKNPDTEGNIDYQTERAKLVRAKRQNEEIELSIKNGELHKAEDIERIMTAMLINFKSRLSAIPAEQAPKLLEKKDTDSIAKLLTEEIKKALMELSDFRTLFCEVIKEDEESDG